MITRFRARYPASAANSYMKNDVNQAPRYVLFVFNHNYRIGGNFIRTVGDGK